MIKMNKPVIAVTMEDPAKATNMIGGKLHMETVLTTAAMCNDLSVCCVIPSGELNVHSGEGSIYGNGEIDKFIPAIEKAKAEGYFVVEPVLPDSFF